MRCFYISCTYKIFNIFFFSFTGQSFSLFNTSGNVRVKEECSGNKESVIFGGGLGEQLGREEGEKRMEIMSRENSQKLNQNGNNNQNENNNENENDTGILAGMAPSIIRESMSRLVRYRMLQVRRPSV